VVTNLHDPDINLYKITSEINRFLRNNGGCYSQDIRNGFKCFQNSHPEKSYLLCGYTYFIRDAKAYTMLQLKYS